MGVTGRIPTAGRIAGAIFASVCLTAVLALPAAAGAQEIYIWEDENGIKHFSDQRPNGDYEVEVQRAIAQPEAPVRMTNVGSKREPEWRFSNRLHGTVTALVTVTDAANVVTEPALPAYLELPPAGHRSVLLGPMDERQPWRYRIEMRAMPGPLNPAFDRNVVYHLPIPAETGIRVDQGFGGEFSHNQPHSLHAVDFTVPTGTPVLAARAGTVMDVERYFHRNGQDIERDGPRANYVRILHPDGTMAVYAHLEYNGVLVRPGQRVRAGQQIARSGNTGFSTGPHLHFAVQVNRNMQLESIPFRMVDEAGRPVMVENPAKARFPR